MTIQTILNLPLIIALILFVLFAIMLGFAAYFSTRSIIHTPVPAEVKSTADSIFRISGTLLGLLLSLTFADVRQELLKIRDSVELEAGQLVDIYHDLMHHESLKANELQNKVIKYVRLVIEEEEEWTMRGNSVAKSWALFEELKKELLTLSSETSSQKSLQSSLLGRIDKIAKSRNVRLFRAKADTPIFLYFAIAGFMLTMALLCVHPPNLSSILLMSLYSAFIGIVLFFIQDLSHPFDGFFLISPEPFEVIYRDITSSAPST